MYKRDKTLILPTTASAISNNLAVNKCEDNDVADSIAVIHHGCINVVSVNESGSPKSKYIPLCDASQQQNANVTQVPISYIKIKQHSLVFNNSIFLL